MKKDKDSILLIEDLLKDLGIEDYSEIMKTSDFLPIGWWIQSITTQEYVLFWRATGQRVIVVRKLGTFLIV